MMSEISAVQAIKAVRLMRAVRDERRASDRAWSLRDRLDRARRAAKEVGEHVGRTYYVGGDKVFWFSAPLSFFLAQGIREKALAYRHHEGQLRLYVFLGKGVGVVEDPTDET